MQIPNGLRQRLPLLVAVAAGAVAVVLVHQYLSQERAKLERERRRLTAEYASPVSVVVAQKDLSEGTTLTASHLAVSTVPEKFVQPYATTAPEDLIGFVTVAPVAEGEQVLRNKLRRSTEAPLGATLSGLTPEGKRAVTIGVDLLTGVGGYVRPGDLVDILWTIQLPKEQGGEPVTVTLFQGVNVLAVADQMVGKTSTDREGNTEYTVTLALNPQEASLLLFAREQGRVQLSLRSRSDKDRKIAVAPANSRALMEAVLGPGAMPAAEPPKTRQVEVYKGLEKTVVAVNE